jgi:hypothetical protein
VDRHVCNTAGIVDSGHGSTGKLCMLGARSAGGSRVRTVDDDNRLWINLSGKSSAGGKYLYGNGADRQAAARYYSAVIRGRPCRVAWFVELNDDDTAAAASIERCHARARCGHSVGSGTPLLRLPRSRRDRQLALPAGNSRADTDDGHNSAGHCPETRRSPLPRSSPPGEDPQKPARRGPTTEIQVTVTAGDHSRCADAPRVARIAEYERLTVVQCTRSAAHRSSGSGARRGW